MRRRSIVVAGIAVAATAMLTIGVGISRSVAAGPQAAPPTHTTEYLPSISDLMIATIQPRHSRLWQAAQKKIGPSRPTNLAICAAPSNVSARPIRPSTIFRSPT